MRNLLTTLRRFKMSSVLNIFGLSVAFAAFFIVMTQVSYERNFDTCYKDTERIYRVSIGFDSVDISSHMSRPMAEALTSGLPQIEKASLVSSVHNEIYITVDRDDGKAGFKELFLNADIHYPDVFGYDLVDGTWTSFEKPEAVLISESMAQKLFGTTAASGKTIYQSRGSVEVAGVYRDFPANSCQKNAIITKIGQNTNRGNWGNGTYNCYITVAKGTNQMELAGLMAAQLDKIELPEEWFSDGGKPKIYVTLNPIESLYYLTSEDFDEHPKGSRTATDMLVIVALLVVAIAAINFVNFATALTPVRIKSINTHKILGSTTSMLRSALIFEAVCITLISYLLSLIWVYMASESPYITSVFITEVDIASNIPMALTTLGLAVFTGIIAGIYPAIYSTSFPPALVIKGSFGMSPKGRKLRTTLIGLQFIISIALIISAAFMQLQNNYMLNYDNGMNGKQIAMVSLDRNLADSTNRTALINHLKSNPLIGDVALSQFRFGSADMFMSWNREFRGQETIQFWCMPVSYNFTDVMGIKVTQGRSFIENDQNKAAGTLVFNDIAKRKYKLNLDETIKGHNEQEALVVGFIEDVNFLSMRKEIEPMALYQYGRNAWTNLREMYIKIEGNAHQAVEHIKKSVAQIDPFYPVSIDFYDTMFDQVYKKEQKTSSMILFFSVLAITISLVGVFGLVMFETQFRRKEIGVRKVFGATVRQMLVMFNKRFVRIVIICFIVAAPIAWWGVNKLLETFAYKTPVYWWVFILALVVVMSITLLTVTIQSWKAATENPVKSIKSE